jgi:trehalose 6-phosphate phosphatase
MRRTRQRGLKPQPPITACASDGLAIFLDLDGTLVDIADKPSGIALGEPLRGLLDRLQQRTNGALALISGRSINDLDGHLRPLTLPVAGQHGLERRSASGIHRAASGRELLEPARQAIDRLLQRHPDVFVEEKGLSLAVHYRNRPVLASWLHRSLRALVADHPGRLTLQRGKRVVEIKLAGADKGKAIAAFLDEAPFRGRRPVFIGDDQTDEHGFAIVNASHGISVKVGAGDTAAHYRLPDVAAVMAWLLAIAEGHS